MIRTILHIDVTAISAWVFSFYPLGRLKLFTSPRVSWIIFYFHLVLRSLILRGWEYGLHAAWSSRLMEIFLHLDLRTFSFPQRLNFSSFLPPSSWRSLLNFQRYPTSARLPLYSAAEYSSQPLVKPFTRMTFCQFGKSIPLSMPWRFACQLSFVVAKVIYSVSVQVLL